MASGKKRSRTQLTLFDCQAPKKLHLESDDMGFSDDDHLHIEDTRSDARSEINDAVQSLLLKQKICKVSIKRT